MFRNCAIIIGCFVIGCDRPTAESAGRAEGASKVAVPENVAPHESAKAALPTADDVQAIVEVAVPAAPTPAWPHWLGPKYDGIAHESGWSSEWPESGLDEVWRKQVGIGFSSMAIADGRLYTMGWADDKETVFCLKPDTGEEIWKHIYPGAKIDNLHDGGPCATPTIDGEFVYTLGREGQLYCLKAASGEVVWEKKLPEETGVEVPEWGFTSSPLIEKDLVIVDGGRVVAFDK